MHIEFTRPSRQLGLKWKPFRQVKDGEEFQFKGCLDYYVKRGNGFLGLGRNVWTKQGNMNELVGIERA